jgi:hypothetical protein
MPPCSTDGRTRKLPLSTTLFPSDKELPQVNPVHGLGAYSVVRPAIVKEI